MTRLWDFAGTDGLALAQALFGPQAAHLAAYQSCETEFSDAPCSLLRLCEVNFRVGVFDDTGGLADALQAEATDRRVWVKPSRLSVIVVKEDALATLPKFAVVKPPHRLAGLPADHAVPVRLDGCAALLWRHAVRGVPALEIQVASHDRDAVCRSLSEVSEKPA